MTQQVEDFNVLKIFIKSLNEILFLDSGFVVGIWCFSMVPMDI